MIDHNLITQLQADDAPPLAKQAAKFINVLLTGMKSQTSIMDNAASVLTDAMESGEGIHRDNAAACINAIRGGLAPLGETTTEQLLDLAYALVGAAAGLPPHTEFDFKHVLSQMSTCITVQGRNGIYLEHLIPLLYWQTPDGTMRLRISAPGEEARFMTFPAGTQWPQALDAFVILQAGGSFAKQPADLIAA